MIGYYEITKDIHDHLKSDNDVNTVKIGSLNEIDLDKQTIFPLSHILVGSAQFINGSVRFGITVSVMDMVDESKNNITDIAEAERWKGIDNRQDVLNSMLAVIERLTKKLRHETLIDGAELISHNAEPFEDRFKNLLTGWSCTYVIDIPNTVQNC